MYDARMIFVYLRFYKFDKCMVKIDTSSVQDVSLIYIQVSYKKLENL